MPFDSDKDADTDQEGSKNVNNGTPELESAGTDTNIAIPSKKSPKSFLLEPIATQHADLILIGCCFISGLIDSCTYNAYTCFAAMQTGNTIFLSLGASHQPASRPTTYKRSLVSIASFSVSCFIFSRLSRILGPKRRITLVSSFIVQIILICVAAMLVQTHAVPSSSPPIIKDIDPRELGPIALLAIQFGAQMVVSRLLGVGEIPTTVLTSIYCDTMMDQDLFRKKIWGKDANVKRNRRIGTIAGLIAGGVSGGWIAKSDGGFAVGLWTAAGVKAVLTICWLFVKREENDTDKRKERK